MMERLALEQFKAWKEKGKRKPLLVTGVRQCGKTYLIKYFGETEFETINGYLISLMEHIPEKGDQFETDIGGYHFKVEDVEDKMIRSISVSKHNLN